MTPGEMIGNAIKQLHLQQKTVAGIACIDPTNLNRIIKDSDQLMPIQHYDWKWR